MLKPWMQLFRISNLPTVASNIAVGYGLAELSGTEINGLNFVLAGVSIVCLYLAGMVMNDVVDLEVDRVERPERPLVSGRISRGQAIVVCVGLFLVAAGCLAGTMSWGTAGGLGIAGSIVAYNWLHKKTVLAVVFMGLARGLIYLTIALACVEPSVVDWRSALSMSLSLGWYTTVLTCLARSENESVKDGRRSQSFLVLVCMAFASSVVTPLHLLLAVGASIVLLVWSIYAAWLYFTRFERTKQAIMMFLAGFCLVDMFWLGIMGKPALMLIALLCFIITAASQRKIMGT